MIPTEKHQQYQHYHLEKLINMNILQRVVTVILEINSSLFEYNFNLHFVIFKYVTLKKMKYPKQKIHFFK